MSNLIRPLLLWVALVATADAVAQAPDPNASAPRGARRDSRMDAADSVRRVERETGGEVLRAEPMQRGGREVYRLKVLTPEGRVRVMQHDPQRRERFRRPERSVSELRASRLREIEQPPPVVVERGNLPNSDDE